MYSMGIILMNIIYQVKIWSKNYFTLSSKSQTSGKVMGSSNDGLAYGGLWSQKG